MNKNRPDGFLEKKVGLARLTLVSVLFMIRLAESHRTVPPQSLCLLISLLHFPSIISNSIIKKLHSGNTFSPFVDSSENRHSIIGVHSVERLQPVQVKGKVYPHNSPKFLPLTECSVLELWDIYKVEMSMLLSQ